MVLLSFCGMASSIYLIRILFIWKLSNNCFKTHFRHNLEKSHTTKRQEYHNDFSRRDELNNLSSAESNILFWFWSDESSLFLDFQGLVGCILLQPSRMVEHPETIAMQPECRTGITTLYIYIIISSPKDRKCSFSSSNAYHGAAISSWRAVWTLKGNIETFLKSN